MEATILNIGITISGALIAVGGAWGLMKTGITANTKDIVEIKRTNGAQWTKINEQGETLAGIDAKVDILLERKKR